MRIVVLFTVILLVLMALAVLPAYVPTGRVSSRPESSAKPPWRKSESLQTVASLRWEGDSRGASWLLTSPGDRMRRR